MYTSPARSTAANVGLWIVQGLLAALFLFAGTMKFIMPVDVMTKGTAFTGGFMHFIGVAELLGALGLVLPVVARRHRELVPIAAAGLLVIMVGAVTVTLDGPQPAQALLPAVVGLLCALVAVARAREQRPAIGNR